MGGEARRHTKNGATVMRPSWAAQGPTPCQGGKQQVVPEIKVGGGQVCQKWHPPPTEAEWQPWQTWQSWRVCQRERES
jgi:hypothetical protein